MVLEVVLERSSELAQGATSLTEAEEGSPTPGLQSEAALLELASLLSHQVIPFPQ